MTSRHEETEIKFDPSPSDAVPDLRDVAGVARILPPVLQRLEATYFDTATLALAKHRITLRRRTGGTDAGWHLKLPSTGDTRHEVHEDVGEIGSAPPASLVDHVRVWVRDSELGPIVELTTQRHVQQILDSDDVVLAELCDDQVTAVILGAQPEVLSWHEWEVELVDGSPKLLAKIAKQIKAAGVRRSSYPSKLNRALGPHLLAGVPRGPVTKHSSALDAVVGYLSEHVDALTSADPAVRRDEFDAVHIMRISTRRLRSALAIYRSVLDRTATDPIRLELKWLADELGKARDAEVMSQRLTSLVDGQDPILVLGAVGRRLESDLHGRYALAHSRIIEALDSARYFRLLESLEDLLMSPPATCEAIHPAAKAMRRLIAHEWKRVRRAHSAAGKSGSRTDAGLHEIRKTLKRLRYAAESAEPVSGRAASRLTEATKRAQYPLGQHQDSVVARELLRQIGVQAHLDGDNGFTYGRLHALEEARAATEETRFDAEFRRLAGRPIAAWIKD